jgi:acid phosphatase family membrane protein YuiD
VLKKDEYKKDEICRQISKLNTYIKSLEQKLINGVKHNFRNIVGHSKEEIMPGVFA